MGQWERKRKLKKRKKRGRGKKKETQEDATANKQTQQRLCTFRSLQGERAWERNGLHYYRTGEHKHSTTLRGQGALSATGAEGGSFGPPEPMSAKESQMRRAVTVVIMVIIIEEELAPNEEK